MERRQMLKTCVAAATAAGVTLTPTARADRKTFPPIDSEKMVAAALECLTTRGKGCSESMLSAGCQALGIESGPGAGHCNGPERRRRVARKDMRLIDRLINGRVSGCGKERERLRQKEDAEPPDHRAAVRQVRPAVRFMPMPSAFRPGPDHARRSKKT